MTNNELVKLEPILHNVDKLVTDEDNFSLTRPFTLEEFQIAVSQMHLDKSPGPDGFNPAFFQNFWVTVGKDVFKDYMSWLNSLHFPPGLNRTNIVLVPECENPNTVRDLRPISLCNMVYKILSKVLCNRIKCTLPELVDKAQSAFISSCSIQDNVLIAFETIHSMKRRNKGKFGDVALKIDISKAYDRVDWNYLEKILVKLGFCSKWVNWVMLCVRSVEFSVIVNDNLVGPIHPARGLRQGDPFSPIFSLFVLKVYPLLSKGQIEGGSFMGAKFVVLFLLSLTCFLLMIACSFVRPLLRSVLSSKMSLLCTRKPPVKPLTLINREYFSARMYRRSFRRISLTFWVCGNL